MGEAIAMTWDPGWVVYRNKINFVYKRSGVRKRGEVLARIAENMEQSTLFRLGLLKT